MSRQIPVNPYYKGTRPRPNPPPDPYLTDAKKFVYLYFDTMDNKRENIVHLYGTTCRLLFDGHPFVGGERINQFWQNQFTVSRHTIRNQDYKCLNDGMLLLTTSGDVHLGPKRRMFSQVLVCQREDGIWKIFSDNYRLLN